MTTSRVSPDPARQPEHDEPEPENAEDPDGDRLDRVRPSQGDPRTGSRKSPWQSVSSGPPPGRTPPRRRDRGRTPGNHQEATNPARGRRPGTSHEPTSALPPDATVASGRVPRTAGHSDRLSHPLNRVVVWVRRGDPRGEIGTGGGAGRPRPSSIRSPSLVDGFDPGLTGARDAVELVAEFSRLEHLASAGVALAARRVAQTDLWKRGGSPFGGALARSRHRHGGGDAVRLLQAAEMVEAAPDTLEALKAGQGVDP